jgi:hypothetical protein
MAATIYDQYFQTYQAQLEDIERGRTGIARVIASPPEKKGFSSIIRPEL